MRNAGLRPVSLDAPLGHDEDSGRVAETVPDENTATPYEQLAVKANHHMVRRLVSFLEPRELEILRFRFGLDGEPEQTLDEVGLKFGLTRDASASSSTRPWSNCGGVSSNWKMSAWP